MHLPSVWAPLAAPDKRKRLERPQKRRVCLVQVHMVPCQTSRSAQFCRLTARPPVRLLGRAAAQGLEAPVRPTKAVLHLPRLITTFHLVLEIGFQIASIALLLRSPWELGQRSVHDSRRSAT